MIVIPTETVVISEQSVIVSQIFVTVTKSFFHKVTLFKWLNSFYSWFKLSKVHLCLEDTYDSALDTCSGKVIDSITEFVQEPYNV